MNRRSFLKLTGLTTAAAAVGATALRVESWWDQRPADDFRILSAQEADITAAIVDAMFPGDVGSPPMPNGVDIGVVGRFDGYLAGLDEASANALRMIVHAIDDMAVVADFGWTRFRLRERAERIEILKAWDHSGLMVRRSAFRALKYALGSQYCNHPAVLEAAGIEYTCGASA